MYQNAPVGRLTEVGPAGVGPPLAGPNGGSVFPRDPEDVRMTTSVMPATGRKLSFLIASDRESFTRAFAESVRLQGYQTAVHEDPAGVAQALAGPGVDAVVLDTDLPGVAWDQLRAALTPDRPAVPEPMDAIERRHILTTLRFTRGNRRNAAQLLGIARSTLLAKIRKFGIDRDESAA